MAKTPIISFVSEQNKDNIPKAIFKTLLKERHPVPFKILQKSVSTNENELSKALANLIDNLKLLKIVSKINEIDQYYFFDGLKLGGFTQW